MPREFPNSISLVLASCALVLVAGCSSSSETTSTESDSTGIADTDPDWPRIIQTDGAEIVLNQPQVDAWPQYQSISGRIATSVLLPDQDDPHYGALEYAADTDVDFESRTVYLINQRVTKATFHADSATSASLSELVKSIETEPNTLSLDFLLEQMVDVEATGHSIEAVYDPPRIIVSRKPALLVLFDGDPVFVRVDSTLDLEFAFNTNWDLFRIPSTGTHYLMDSGHWLVADKYSGPWKPTLEIPEQFAKLPDDENWSEVRSRLDVVSYKSGSEPVVTVSTVPAELIIIDGQPEWEDIDGTSLAFVTNSTSDLFFARSTNLYYYLVSGRWFEADDLQGAWSSALNELPPDFDSIPADHSKAHVRASVPGTPEAQEAIRLANVPQQAEISRSDVSLDVAYDGDPQFEEIEETTAQRATNTTQDVFLVDDRYYACEDAVWFTSDGPNGPWVVADEVPDAIYDIPPSSPAHNVTYVYVYDSTEETVTTGYTGGYSNMYVSSGVVVYGTGWYYPPYFYYPPYYAYPIYHPYPHSYGVAAGYNPYTGNYWRAGAAYGPYGGYGGAAAYNPRTGTYARSAAAYGPYGAARGYRAYNPRTGTAAGGYQVRTPYESWGRGAVRQGDKWVQGGYYANRDGAIAGARGSEGGAIVKGSGEHGSGTVVRDREGNLYAGKDGNVYKKGDDGWQQYEGDSWKKAESGPSTSDRGRGTEFDGVQHDGQKRSYGNQRSYQSRSGGWGARGGGRGR